MHAKITLLPGDGIGPEVVAEGVKVLEAVAAQFGHTFEFTEALIGGIAIDETGNPLPDETLAACRASDAVLLGAVGGPKWSDPRAPVRPEQGLLGLREELGLFANLRPVKVYPALVGASTLKPEVVAGVDLVIVRELTGGLYFGKPQGQSGEKPNRSGVDTMRYTEGEIERLMRVAFELARGRRKKVTSVDKANVLASSRLWREVAHEVARDYPDVELRGCAGGRLRDVPDPPPGRLRRDRHREHVRRHPLRRGLDAGRLHGHAAVGVAGRGQVRPVRADPRQRARHRRARASPTRWRPS